MVEEARQTDDSAGAGLLLAAAANQIAGLRPLGRRTFREGLLPRREDLGANESDFADPYLGRTSYLRPRPGLSSNDEWRERVFGSFHLTDCKEVLIVGPFSFSSALLFASRNPTVNFCAVEGERRINKYARLAQQKGLTNVRFFAFSCRRSFAV